MKNQLLIPCIMACAIVQFASTAFSQPVPPVRLADCPPITEVPTIDGLDSEAFWSPEQDMTRFSEMEGDWDGESDFTTSFKMAWSWSYFYAIVKITDEVDHSWNGSDGLAYEFDNIEFYFQLDTCTVPNTYTDNTIQLRYNRGAVGWQSSTFRAGQTADNFLTYSENTADGWVLECGIPWTNIMPDGSLPEDIHNWIKADNRIIGFDMLCRDSDGNDPLVGVLTVFSQTAWDEDGEVGDIADGTEDNAWQDTRVFGYLNMVDDPHADVFPPENPDAAPVVAVDNGFKVYPNPAANTLSVYGATNPVEIYTIAGVHVMTIETGIADISHLASGIYIVRSGNTSTLFRKN
jgi:hypothetical protein